MTTKSTAKAILKNKAFWGLLLFAVGVGALVARAFGYESLDDLYAVAIMVIGVALGGWGMAQHIKAGPTGIDISRGDGCEHDSKE